MDLDGNLKGISKYNKEYAIDFVNLSTSYTIVKIQFDPNTNGKKYNCLLRETQMSSSLKSKL